MGFKCHALNPYSQGVRFVARLPKHVQSWESMSWIIKPFSNLIHLLIEFQVIWWHSLLLYKLFESITEIYSLNKSYQISHLIMYNLTKHSRNKYQLFGILLHLNKEIQGVQWPWSHIIERRVSGPQTIFFISNQYKYYFEIVIVDSVTIRNTKSHQDAWKEDWIS